MVYAVVDAKYISKTVRNYLFFLNKVKSNILILIAIDIID